MSRCFYPNKAYINFNPFLAFKKIFSFEITDLENGKGHVKIYGDIEWKESVMFVAKTAIQSSVAKSIKDAAHIYVKGLTNYESEVTF